MKTFKNLILCTLLVLSTFIFMSCPNPLSVSEEITDDSIAAAAYNVEPIGSGELEVRIPMVSSYMLEALGAEVSPTLADSRALMLARSVEVSLYDSEGTLVDSITGSDTDTDGYYTMAFSGIPYGTGYSVGVNVYNSDVSTTDPVLSGGDSSIVLGPGSNYAYVYPIPVNPETITASDSESMTSIGYDFDYGLISEFGAEKWYSFAPSSDVVEITVTPDSTSGIYVAVYNRYGYFVEYAVSEGFEESGTLGNPASIVVDVSDYSQYYIGIISIDLTASAHSFDIQIGEPDPVSLNVVLSDSGSYEGADVIYRVTSSYSADPLTDYVAYNTAIISSGIASATMLDASDSTTWEEIGSWYIYALIDLDGSGDESTGDLYYETNFTLPSDSELNLYSAYFNAVLGADSYEDDGTYDLAAELVIDTPQLRSLYEEGDQDWAYFTAVSGTTYVIETQIFDSNLDTYMYLYDSSMTQLSYDDDGGSSGNFSKITYTAAADEILYVMVRGYSSSETGFYILSLTQN